MVGPEDCAGRSCLVYDEALTSYDLGPTHPMKPVRVELTVALAAALGVLDGLPTVPAPPGTDADLLTVHTPGLLAAVRAARPGIEDQAHGLGTEDDPVFAGMHRAARHVVGASVEAARRVWQGPANGGVLHAANIAGGLHHAMPDQASGFCVYNDPAIAIRWLLDNGAQRVAYVDVDVHHGDGVERIFWDDPRVLTISLHETGLMLFPGTGFPGDLGGPSAQGSAVNVALPPGTADAGWLRAFHAVVPPLVRAFAPDVLVTQQGCDSHRDDPLADLMLTVDGHRASYLALHDLAHEAAQGRWVAFGGGGYAVADVVPRSWTHLLAVLSGRPLDPGLDTPASWRREVEARLGTRAPVVLTDGQEPAFRAWEEGWNPDNPLDRAVNATREAAFPFHGLLP